MDTSDFRNGLHIYVDDQVFTIIEFQHVKPGKGGAFVRTKLRNLRTGGVVDKTFRAGERVEQAFLTRRPMQFLYRSGDELTLMDLETYEQAGYPASLFGDGLRFLKEEMQVHLLDVDGEPIGVELPNSVELVVTETDPSFRGDTVSGSSKPATLETGARINVPFHINVGDAIRVDTRTGEYLERVKK